MASSHFEGKDVDLVIITKKVKGFKVPYSAIAAKRGSA